MTAGRGREVQGEAGKAPVRGVWGIDRGGPDLVWAPDLSDVAILVWADNVFVLASSWAELRLRVAVFPVRFGICALVSVIPPWRSSRTRRPGRGFSRFPARARDSPTYRSCECWASVLMQKAPPKRWLTSALERRERCGAATGHS